MYQQSQGYLCATASIGSPFPKLLLFWRTVKDNNQMLLGPSVNQHGEKYNMYDRFNDTINVSMQNSCRPFTEEVQQYSFNLYRRLLDLVQQSHQAKNECGGKLDTILVHNYHSGQQMLFHRFFVKSFSCIFEQLRLHTTCSVIKFIKLHISTLSRAYIMHLSERC